MRQCLDLMTLLEWSCCDNRQGRGRQEKCDRCLSFRGIEVGWWCAGQLVG